MGLVSQAGVTLGITVTVSGEFAEWGPRMATLVVAVVAIHLVAGPILFRRALARAGEVGGAGQSTSRVCRLGPMPSHLIRVAACSACRWRAPPSDRPRPARRRRPRREPRTPFSARRPTACGTAMRPGRRAPRTLDVPTLTVFRVHSRTGRGTAIVIAPGGAYRGLAANLEGRQVADWFAARGVTAFVLKYRLGNRYLYPTPLVDARRAMRFVRAHAAEFDIAPDRIGMMGFSAGGHLTAMAATMPEAGRADAADPLDRVSSRPDFQVLGYPWLNAMTKDQKALGYCRVLKIDPAQCAHVRAVLARAPGGEGHAAGVHLHHDRRRAGAGGRQRDVLSGAERGRRAGRDAHLRDRPARQRARPRRRGPRRVAGTAGNVAARPRPAAAASAPAAALRNRAERASAAPQTPTGR